MVLCTLLTGRPGLEGELAPTSEPSGDLDSSSSQVIPSGGLLLCAQMLASDGRQRPSAAECLCHFWLEDDAATSQEGEALPLEALAAAVQIHEREQLRDETVGLIVRELSSGSLSCGGAAFSALAELGRSPDDRPGGNVVQARVPYSVRFYLQDAKYGSYVAAQGGQAIEDGLDLQFTLSKDFGIDRARMQFIAEYCDDHRFFLKDAKHGRYVQPQGGEACKNGVELQFHAGKASGAEGARMQFIKESDADGRFYLKDAKHGRYVHPRGGQANNAITLVFWSGKDSGSDCSRMQFIAEYEVLHAAAQLQRLGLSVETLQLVARAFDPDGLGSIDLGCLAAGCLELAEDQLDRALWQVFQVAGEDHIGVLGAAQFEQVLDGGAIAAFDSEDNLGCMAAPEGSCRRLRAALDLDPELTASEVVRHIAQGGHEVSFEALKDFVMGKRGASRARGVGNRQVPEHCGDMKSVSPGA